jgi:hypothetical protein
MTVVAIAAAIVPPVPARSESDTTSGTIIAQIARPMALNEAANMSFGWLARPASPGMARITPGNRVVSSGLALTKSDGTSPAKIVISGAPNQIVGLLVSRKASFGPMARKVAVSEFTHNGGPMPALGPDGRATIELGATLRVAANLREGRYRGEFDVILSNN